MATKFLEPGGDATFNDNSTANGGFWGIAGGGGSIVTDFVHGGHIKSIKYAPSGNYDISGDGVLRDAGSRISIYLYIVTLPSGSARIFAAGQAGAGSVGPTVRITSAGVLQLWNGSTAQIGTNGATLNTGQWYRISLAYTITSTTVNRFELFVDAVSSISVTNATLNNISTSDFLLGNITSDANFDVRVSDIYVDDSNALTDPGNIWVTAKRPISNGSLNEFTTQIGSGGSGVGSGHSPQVNERALSTTNGWSVINAGSIKTEEYSIESLSAGDIDLTGATIKDFIGWVYASSVTSETAKIRVVNVDANISLTSSAAMFTKVAGSTTYPAGNTDIGILTDTTVTTVGLYECGIVVAYIPSASSPSSSVSSSISKSPSSSQSPSASISLSPSVSVSSSVSLSPSASPSPSSSVSLYISKSPSSSVSSSVSASQSPSSSVSLSISLSPSASQSPSSSVSLSPSVSVSSSISLSPSASPSPSSSISSSVSVSVSLSPSSSISLSPSASPSPSSSISLSTSLSPSVSVSLSPSVSVSLSPSSSVSASQSISSSVSLSDSPSSSSSVSLSVSLSPSPSAAGGGRLKYWDGTQWTS